MGFNDFVWRSGGYEAVMELNSPPETEAFYVDGIDNEYLERKFAGDIRLEME